MSSPPDQSNLIGGEHCAALSGRTLEVLDPADGLPFTTLPRSDGRDVNAAVAAARSAFRGAWGRQTATERGRILMRLSALVQQHHVGEDDDRHRCQQQHEGGTVQAHQRLLEIVHGGQAGSGRAGAGGALT